MGNSAQSRAACKEAEAAKKEGDAKARNGAAPPKAAPQLPARVPSEWELTVKPDPLTEKQIALLQENWKELEDNIEKVGVIWFISLFETHPDVQEVFIPFKGMAKEELRNNKTLKAHALKVMAFVQKAVARLYERDKLDVLLRELGKKHYSYGAKQKYIDLIAPQFIEAIKPSLEATWSDELELAWVALFNYMGTIMKAAMDIEERRAAAATIPYAVPSQNS
ncbi:non-symbiotic hemoglobin 1-like [Ischnura elegans]|uniref:non-symbiotic hemoglobin 1-like n=1 Tax=Ischnura elegans TaxID=197161 RepID=UPI001ED8947C|nr:non-symbiotic hemoglobin 1-like [Ischnura elegans]